ncbi:MAG: HAMP domain-containing sensor histidine kinase [Gemmataceae bacterium]
MRIRVQLLLPVALILFGVVGIGIGSAYSATRLATRQIEARLRSVARFVVEDSWFPLRENVLRRLSPLSGAEYLLDCEPRLASRETLVEVNVVPLPIADHWQDLTLGAPVQVEGVRYLASGIRLSRGDSAGQVLYIFYPESLWRDALWEAAWPSLLLGSLLGLAALGLAWWQARHLSRRIDALEQATRAIASGDFTPMPLPPGEDELSDLARSVNDMAGQLARLQEAIRRTERLHLLGQLAGGLAHQLRNSLTGARLAVQLHRSETPGDSPALEVALRELTLLETQVRRLLDLGKTPPTHRQACDLSERVTQAVELLQPRCQHAKIQLDWQSPGSCRAVVDAGQWDQVILNLLTNAIEAAGPGGLIRVSLHPPLPPAKLLVLEVADNGPGPQEAIVTRLFEPFVTTKPEGVGLGLAVARQIVEAHGGRLTWRREAGWTIFRAQWENEG